MRGAPAAAAVLLAALVSAPATASAQAREEPAKAAVEIPADGTELLRALLDRAGVKPVKQREFRLLGRYDDVMVIALGSPSGFADVGDPADFARRVIQQGGAALVATDDAGNVGNRLQRDPNFGQRIQAFFGAGRVRSGDPDAALRGFDDCPFVVPLTAPAYRNAPAPESPIGRVFQGLTRVATNDPAALRVAWYDGEFRYALAGFPRSAEPRSDSYLTIEDAFGRQIRQPLPPDAVFAAGGYGPDNWNGLPYRYLALADHSVFINQMLIEPGTQNLELTYRVIEFLQSGRQAKRNRCVFFENGRVVEQFDGLRQAFAPPKPPIPPIDPKALQGKLADFGNSLLDHVQTNDVANRALLSLFRFPSVVRFFLILFAIYATWYLLRRMVFYRKPTDVPPAPAVAGVPAGPPGVFDRRQKELIRRNNLCEPVRDLLREFFASVGVHGEPGPKPPRLEISDAVRKPESLRQAVRDFWKLAYGPPQEVTVTRWRELEPYFVRLRQAHADGKWRLAPG